MTKNDLDSTVSTETDLLRIIRDKLVSGDVDAHPVVRRVFDSIVAKFDGYETYDAFAYDHQDKPQSLYAPRLIGETISKRVNDLFKTRVKRAEESSRLLQVLLSEFHSPSNESIQIVLDRIQRMLVSQTKTDKSRDRMETAVKKTLTAFADSRDGQTDVRYLLEQLKEVIDDWLHQQDLKELILSRAEQLKQLDWYLERIPLGFTRVNFNVEDAIVEYQRLKQGFLLDAVRRKPKGHKTKGYSERTQVAIELSANPQIASATAFRPLFVRIANEDKWKYYRNRNLYDTCCEKVRECEDRYQTNVSSLVSIRFLDELKPVLQRGLRVRGDGQFQDLNPYFGDELAETCWNLLEIMAQSNRPKLAGLRPGGSRSGTTPAKGSILDDSNGRIDVLLALAACVYCCYQNWEAASSNTVSDENGSGDDGR